MGGLSTAHRTFAETRDHINPGGPDGMDFDYFRVRNLDQEAANSA